MKATELRLGNYVSVNRGDGFVTIVVDLDLLAEIQKADWPFEPIAITGDWLMKLGFTICESKIIDNPDIFTIQISNHETLDYEDEEFFIAGVNSHRVVDLWNSPKYVHQLQNLYFALTGEELATK